MKLCIGSGDKPEGDVNMDRYREYTPQSGDHKRLTKIKRGECFVQGDAQYLPFKDKSFDFVVAREVLEHVDKPLQMLGEMRRVCSGVILLTVPDRRGRWAKMPHHKHYFDPSWFQRALKGHDVEVAVTSVPWFAGIPVLKFIPLMRPDGVLILIRCEAPAAVEGAPAPSASGKNTGLVARPHKA